MRQVLNFCLSECSITIGPQWGLHSLRYGLNSDLQLLEVPTGDVRLQLRHSENSRMTWHYTRAQGRKLAEKVYNKLFSNNKYL